MAKKVLVVLGTRPEAIKLCPLILQLRSSSYFETIIYDTAQHRDMVKPFLHVFGIKADGTLNIMQEEQDLFDITTKVLIHLKDVLDQIRPEILVVQGDTSTALAASLSAFYAKIPIAHVEAGLRTGDKYAPFPEEINRTFISHIADYNFAPTAHARENLLREGIASERIFVTGNTVVDALNFIKSNLRRERIPNELLNFTRPRNLFLDGDRRLILVTAHRRESFGVAIQRLCDALFRVVERNPQVFIVYPVHPNPNVMNVVQSRLRSVERLFLLPPVSYTTLLWLMQASYLILTDSGGIQEEAPAFGKPVLVLRDTTERPEGVQAGVARLVGMNPECIVRETERLLYDQGAYEQMAKTENPYGDGRAAQRICQILEAYIGGCGAVR